MALNASLVASNSGHIGYHNEERAAINTIDARTSNVNNTADVDKPVSTAAQAQFDIRAVQAFYSGTAWPARPSGAPTTGLHWVSSTYISASAPPAGTTGAHDGDFWYCHPSAA